MTITHFHLAGAFLETKDFDEAAEELEIVVARMPAFEEAHQMLETAYARAGRIPEAIKECEKVLESDPHDYGSNLLLGQVLVRAGDSAAAVPRLREAASLRPGAPEPHLSLADAYAKLGRNNDAQRERAVGKRLAVNQSVPGPSEPR
jgi:predicted Zn-dependent protease